MRLALLADAYPPLRSSGAVQLRDLSLEFARIGHEVSVMVAAPELNESWQIETWKGVRIVRLKTPRTKDTGYIRRTIGECLMPFAMLRNLRRSPLSSEVWDGVVWYSPTIFLGPLVSALKRASRCRSYLIVRDIFPEWAADMGLLRKGFPYWFFKLVANYQYSVADVIGIQTEGNRAYFANWLKHSRGRVEVLQNWLAVAPSKTCSISIKDTPLFGRKIVVYAGNMGIAQGMGIVLQVAERLKRNERVGFVFVGRGSDACRLRAHAAARALDNVIFFDEIDPDEVAALYAQCHAGLVALDPRHKTHNIPGKFLSYMQAGLPVIATINPGNDLAALISTERVGRVSTDGSMDSMALDVLALLDEIEHDNAFQLRCKALAAKLFSPTVAVNQIVRGLRG